MKAEFFDCYGKYVHPAVKIVKHKFWLRDGAALISSRRIFRQIVLLCRQCMGANQAICWNNLLYCGLWLDIHPPGCMPERVFLSQQTHYRIFMSALVDFNEDPQSSVSAPSITLLRSPSCLQIVRLKPLQTSLIRFWLWVFIGTDALGFMHKILRTKVVRLDTWCKTGSRELLKPSHKSMNTNAWTSTYDPILHTLLYTDLKYLPEIGSLCLLGRRTA